jgi:dipeptidase
VARLNTEVSVVVEPRRNLPAAMAHRVWCCLSTSLSGVFVPFHVGIDQVEEHYALAGGRYDPRSAYWLFTELAKLVDYKYRACAEVVQATWQRFEDKTARALADEELRWASLAPDDLREAVTDFDGRTAGEAIHALENLLAEVKTRAFYEDF